MSNEAICGDVVFVGYEPRSSFVVDSISAMTQGKGESPTVAVHQGQILAGGDIMEADGLRKNGRVIIHPWKDRAKALEADPKAHYIVFRPPLSTYQTAAIEFHGRRMDGIRYGYLETLLQAADGGLRKLGWLREDRPFFTYLGMLAPWTVICSGAGNQVLSKAGVLPHLSVYWAPDHTFDFAVEHEWRIVDMDSRGLKYWALEF